MVFNSWVFAVFFLVVYSVYLRLGHERQNDLLLAAGYVFYGYWDYRFLSLLLLSTATDFLCGLGLARWTNRRVRRGLLGLSLATNLGMLGLFKYYDFFASSLAALLARVGIAVEPHLLRLTLPVGISFYTFQSLGYVFDVYRGHLPPVTRLRDFALFVSFFPQLMAGPIERARALAPRIQGERVVTPDDLASGAWLLAQGYFLKVFVADNAAVLADRVFGRAGPPDGATALLGIYAFSVQIYGDFAGYSQIARGLARLMGFDLMVNFQRPYLAVSPTDFWRRWHISLSTWLRDFLFLPTAYAFLRRARREALWGIRMEAWGYAVASGFTMAVAGLWHGAAWRFVLWGLYHGALLVVFRSVPGLARTPRHPVRRALRTLAYFQLTAVGWLLFRAASLAQAGAFLRAIGSGVHWYDGAGSDVAFLAALALPVLLLDCVEEQAPALRRALGGIGFAVGRQAPVERWARASAAVLMCILVALLGSRGDKPFIYFQF